MNKKLGLWLRFFQSSTCTVATDLQKAPDSCNLKAQNAYAVVFPDMIMAGLGLSGGYRVIKKSIEERKSTQLSAAS